MDFKKFYIGYIITFLAFVGIMLFNFSFVKVMAILGTALLCTVILIAFGWIIYRTIMYLFQNTSEASGGVWQRTTFSLAYLFFFLFAFV